MLSIFEIVLFAATAVLTVWLSLKEFGRKFRLIGQGKDPIQPRKPKFGEMIKRVMLQLCVFLRRPVTGFFHAVIFWGFLVFLLITLNHTAEGFVRGFSLFGHGVINDIILFGANIFAFLIILAVIYFLVRRYVFKPSTLEIPSVESLIILSFIFTLMISFIFFEAIKMYETGVKPINFLGAWSFENILPLREAIGDGTIIFWEKFLWWLHILLVMAFAVVIPRSKHLHLVMGPMNILMKHDGVLAEIPHENLEEKEQFGAPTIRDFTKKDLMDLFSCAECGRCDDVCPALRSGKELSPKTLLNKLKENLFASEEEFRKENPELKTLLADVVSEAEIWDCTTCGGCMAVCPMFNEHIPKIMGMRQFGVLMEGKFPEELSQLYKGLENQGNPWGLSADKRAEWAKDLDIPLMAEKQTAEVLLWVGCEGSYDSQNQKNIRMMAEVLKKAGVDFAWLGTEEKCCGDPARRSGHEYLFQMLAAENIETMKQYSFKRIITMCPHGYHVLKHEYKQLGAQYDVQHYSTFLMELIHSGQIRLKGGSSARLTYHDPCYLGRYNAIYEAPREIIRKTGAQLMEMKDCKLSSFCCGAGGGGMWKEESKGERINHIRIDHAKATGADTLVTSCPYCAVMFKDAIDEKQIADFKTIDLIRIVHENMA